MNNTTKQKPTEAQVRLYVRKLAIEHYAKNGLANISPQEVQRRLLMIEAKAKGAPSSKTKMDKKLLGSKKSIGNSAPNANWILSKSPKKKDVAPGSKAEKQKGASSTKHAGQSDPAKYKVSKSATGKTAKKDW